MSRGCVIAGIAAIMFTMVFLASRPNVYSGSPLDRAAQFRDNAAWIEAALASEEALFVPVWRARNLMRGVAEGMAPLLGPDTVVLTAMNGVPWWFFDGLGGPLDGARLEATDPGGVIASAIPAHHVVGCVVHASCALLGPGHVKHHFGNGLIVGEPSGGTSARYYNGALAGQTVTTANLASVNSAVMATLGDVLTTPDTISGAAVSSGTALQTTAMGIITAYATANTNTAPTVQDYLDAGITGVTRTLAKEWGQFKINVNAVAFGFVETRLTAAIPLSPSL